MRIDEPLHAGRIQLEGRLAVPPMATQSTEWGVPGQETIAHYEAFAATPRLSLIETEHAFIDPQGRADPYQMSFADDSVIEAQRRLAKTVPRRHPGVRLFAQISHAGLNASSAVTGQELVSASSLRLQSGVSRALALDEIARIEDEFAKAAVRVKESGYDGVEIHAAHGYLLNQFLSPLTNFRTDAYGPQSIENRTRIIVETVEKVRAAVGDFPISVRLGGCDYTDGGSTLADAAAAASLIEKAGADMLSISGGFNIYMRPGHREPAGSLTSLRP